MTAATPVQLRPTVRISLSLTGAGGRIDMGDLAPPPVTLATLQQIFIGAPGLQGPAGGPQGPIGPAGAKGDKGDPGQIRFTGHGPPPAVIVGACPHDTYMDLDTGSIYQLT